MKPNEILSSSMSSRLSRFDLRQRWRKAVRDRHSVIFYLGLCAVTEHADESIDTILINTWEEDGPVEAARITEEFFDDIRRLIGRVDQKINDQSVTALAADNSYIVERVGLWTWTFRLRPALYILFMSI